MGTYVNPGNNSFRSAVRSEIYVDKTGLISILNRMINTESRCFAVSRARRFGKSMAAGMIDAYYSRGCDSRELFAPYEVAQAEDFAEHLNKYNVLHFDTASFFNSARTPAEVIPLMDQTLLEAMKKEFPFLQDEKCANTAAAINMVYEHDGIQFVVIIDEWECIIRDAKDNDRLITDYLKYLRNFFKTEESKQFLALGYITGILPVKKIEGESALNNFREYTMISPKNLAPYFGFSESEVDNLCRENGMSVEDIRRWYDGYLMKWQEGAPVHQKKELHIYNPNSIVNAMMDKVTDSYWKNTGAFRGLNTFIARNEAGLKDDVIAMVAGNHCPVKVKSFQNDLTGFKKKDDVLTALIHMGYLGYDSDTEEAFVPNEEVREVFESAIDVGDWTDVQDALDHADELLKATWAGETKKIAETIARSQQDYASIIHYHDENALACAVMMSYYTARKYYYVKRELPAGKGFADIVFIPRREGEHPAMIVELKWNRSANSAIRQIRAREYTGVLSDYHGELLLVGINYNRKTGKYTSRIERSNP